VALQLRKHGIRHVRPLLGGFHEWKKLGFPLVEIAEAHAPLPPSNGAIAAEGRA
jgi:3-mercaptopyruvate sulfurtransferase SseA